MSVRIGLFYPNTPTMHAISHEVAERNLNAMEIQTHVDVAQAAEEIGLDYLFMADAWGSYGPKATEANVQDPILLAPILAAALIPVTKKIRLITTIHTSWFDPLAVARIGSALDCLSNGRWGVNIVSGTGFGGHLANRLAPEFDHDARYERAAEFVEVVTQLWSQGEVNFTGNYFAIEGAIVGPQTVQQPRPLIVSAGASDAGREFAGQHADYIFMPGRTPQEECAKRTADINRIARDAGRPEGAVKLQMHASVLVRETNEEAIADSKALADAVDLDVVAEYLNSVRGAISTYDDIYASLGELQMRQIGSVSGSRKIHGGPDEVADQIEHLVKAFGCDGIAITLPVWRPEEIRRFGELVLPRLESRGLWQHPKTRNWSW
ncbi:LLM class flavin-dependent oxidoreductase [Sneathiella sp.]|uniref:LLM class flavin-dependent oxidoreductase n=1 Tax=Sneathiella sp. TaxID=1964365 RepID=UPI0035663819